MMKKILVLFALLTLGGCSKNNLNQVSVETSFSNHNIVQTYYLTVGNNKPTLNNDASSSGAIMVSAMNRKREIVFNEWELEPGVSITLDNLKGEVEIQIRAEDISDNASYRVYVTE